MTSDIDTLPTKAIPLDIASLPSVAEFGFHGGRESLSRFCEAVFQPGGPRFLRDGDYLSVFRQADLRALAAMPQMGNVPAGVLYKRTMAASAAMPDQGELAGAYVGQAMAEVFANQFFFNNEPIHAPLRRMTLMQIGPKAVPQLQAEARRLADEIIAETPRDTPIDFLRDVTEKLTVRFWGGQIGLSADEMLALSSVLHTMSEVFNRKRGLDGFREMDDAFAAYAGLVERAILRSLAAGDRPFVAVFAEELAKLDLQDDPDLAGIVPPNAGTMLGGVLTDGFHLAAVGTANVVHVLSRRPDVYSAVRADLKLLPAAMGEALRLEPPALLLNRYTLDEVEYDGVIIPKGVVVSMMWGAGNQDPSIYSDPETFDLSRSLVGATTFGGGAQICPGRHAVGMFVKCVLEALFEAGLDVEPVSERDDWMEHHILSQLRTFPVRLRAQA